MSVSLALVVLVLVARAPSSAGQANGKFWWLRSSTTAAQQDSMMPGTIPPAAVQADSAAMAPEAAAMAPEAVASEVLTAPPPPALEEASAASEENTGCVCVDYYLCGRDGYIITSGEGIIDVRVGDVLTGAACGGIQVCCKRPRKVQRNTTTTATTTTTTTEPSLYPPEDCGIRGGDVISNMVDVRILSDDGRNGSTEFAEFPWMLALLRIQDSAAGQQEKNMFVCGASLVHPQVAMTAAHCVSRRRVSELKLRAGEWDTQNKNEPLPHQDRQVTRIAVHPGFYEGTLYNDVALLFLDSPFQLARNVRTVCLPQQGDVLDGSRCIATGWGRNAFGGNGTYQMTLKKVEMPVVARDVCQGELRNTRLSSYFHLHESFVCAGGERRKDTCQGDGGGPLFCRSPRDSGRYVQLGITSWGIGCGDTDVPAVYANVPSFADWVASQLPEVSGLVDGGPRVVASSSSSRRSA